MQDNIKIYDMVIIGGGINGTGIAADAAGRGLSVYLCEKDDLANHTSSASSKLIHGGLRYLEHKAFRLVREALAERAKHHKKEIAPEMENIAKIKQIMEDYIDGKRPTIKTVMIEEFAKELGKILDSYKLPQELL